MFFVQQRNIGSTLKIITHLLSIKDHTSNEGSQFTHNERYSVLLAQVSMPSILGGILEQALEPKFELLNKIFR